MWRALLASDRAKRSTSSSRSSLGTTRFRKPLALASAASKGRQVRTSSFVMAGPISRTKRGMPPQAKGMPRSTSGMEKRASCAAIRRSQAAARTRPPPTHQPWMRARLSAFMFSRASAMVRPHSAASRVESPPGSFAPEKVDKSAPAEKARPAPPTMTTLTSGCSSNHRAASAISMRAWVERGLSFSGRSSWSRPIDPSVLIWRV